MVLSCDQTINLSMCLSLIPPISQNNLLHKKAHIALRSVTSYSPVRRSQSKCLFSKPHLFLRVPKTMPVQLWFSFTHPNASLA